MTNIDLLIIKVEALAAYLGNLVQSRGFKTGGTAGQVPVKTSGSDFAWAWGSPTVANLTGVVTSSGGITSIADGALSISKTSGLQSALNLKADLSGATFTGTVFLSGTSLLKTSRLNLAGLPTSDAGLTTGDIWNDAGVLAIV